MDDPKNELIESYRQLVALFQEQTAIANNDSYDEQLDEIFKLEQLKLNYSSVIDRIRLNSELYNDIVEVHRESIAQYIDMINKLNDALILRINELYAEASKDMKQVVTQRKTLQSYGGVNYSDVISYYFDEKK